jgi:hypothetical protein
MPTVKVNFSKENVGDVEILVPKGTTISDLAKMYVAIDKQIGKQLYPRGCSPCLSGAHFVVREILDGAARVKY